MNKKELLINLILNAIFMCIFILITDIIYNSLQPYRQFSVIYFISLFLSAFFILRVGCSIFCLVMLPYFKEFNGDDEDGRKKF